MRKEKLANAASSLIFVNLEYLSSALVLDISSDLVLMFSLLECSHNFLPTSPRNTTKCVPSYHCDTPKNTHKSINNPQKQMHKPSKRTQLRTSLMKSQKIYISNTKHQFIDKRFLKE